MEGNSDSRNKYSEDNIVDMLDFLVDNIFVVFVGTAFQIVGTPKHFIEKVPRGFQGKK